MCRLSRIFHNPQRYSLFPEQSVQADLLSLGADSARRTFPFANIRCIYCVATQIPILNVSKIRLRLEFVWRLVSVLSLCKRLTEIFFSVSRVNASDRVDTNRRILRQGLHLNRAAVKFWRHGLVILRAAKEIV